MGDDAALLLQHAHHGQQELQRAAVFSAGGRPVATAAHICGAHFQGPAGRGRQAQGGSPRYQQELEGKPYYHCIQKDTVGQPCYLINNMADKEDDKADSVREHLSSARLSLELKVTVMWYICKQITQGTSQKFFRFQDLNNGGKLLLYLPIYMKSCRAKCGIYKE